MAAADTRDTTALHICVMNTLTGISRSIWSISTARAIRFYSGSPSRWQSGLWEHERQIGTHWDFQTKQIQGRVWCLRSSLFRKTTMLWYDEGLQWQRLENIWMSIMHVRSQLCLHLDVNHAREMSIMLAFGCQSCFSGMNSQFSKINPMTSSFYARKIHDLDHQIFLTRWQDCWFSHPTPSGREYIFGLRVILHSHTILYLQYVPCSLQSHPKGTKYVQGPDVWQCHRSVSHKYHWVTLSESPFPKHWLGMGNWTYKDKKLILLSNYVQFFSSYLCTLYAHLMQSDASYTKYAF